MFLGVDTDVSVQDRLQRERDAANEGEVTAHSIRFHHRFAHVFDGPDAKAMNRRFETAVATFAADSDVLEIGCHAGGLVRLPSLTEARSRIGIDLSEVAVREIGGAFAPTGELLAVADAHKLPFADASFDVVCGRAIIHHLVVEEAAAEIARVLRPGGHAVFLEPLGDNPLWKLARWLTPKARTADEKALRRSQVDARRDGLVSADHGFIGLATVPTGAVTTALGWQANNGPLRLAARLDQSLAATPLRWWMRQILLVWRRA